MIDKYYETMVKSQHSIHSIFQSNAIKSIKIKTSIYIKKIWFKSNKSDLLDFFEEKNKKINNPVLPYKLVHYLAVLHYMNLHYNE